MLIKIKRALRYFRANIWEFVFYSMFIVFVVFVWYYSYNYFLINFNYKNDIANKNKEIKLLWNDLDIQVSKDWYDRFVLVKYLDENFRNTNWYSTVASIIDITEKIELIDDTETLKMENFKIDMDKISFDGYIPEHNLNRVYNSWWIIDSFVWLPFIESVNIPNYQKENDEFKFHLDANIILNEWPKN